jgi:hypothetical protein
MQDPFRLSGRAIEVPEAPMPRAQVSGLLNAASYLLMLPGIPAALIGVITWLVMVGSLIERPKTYDMLPWIMLLTAGLGSGIVILVRSVMAPSKLRANQPMPAIVTAIWTIMHNLSQVALAVAVFSKDGTDHPTPLMLSMVYPALSVAYALWLLAIAVPMRNRLQAWRMQQESRNEQVARVVLAPDPVLQMRLEQAEEESLKAAEPDRALLQRV